MQPRNDPSLRDLFRALDGATRNAIVRQAGAIGVSLIPFGLAFGGACTKAKLNWLQALAFSSLVFTGGSQFAAVGVLADGGSSVAAITAGLLLGIRSLVYGIVMAPWLRGSKRFRAAASQLMIDESLAVSTAQPEVLGPRQVGYFAGGLSVFVVWNISTVVGAIAFANAGSFVTDWGLDASIPAAFAALLWPRLKLRDQRAVAFVGALIALLTIPVVPAGIPIVLAALATIVGFLPRFAPERAPESAASSKEHT